MNPSLPLVSLVVAAAFFAVLCGFVVRLAGVLAGVADKLGVVRVSVDRMRDDCTLISPAVDAMNQNLYRVAAELAELGDLAERLWTNQD